ncbi:hypothetical protein ACV2ZF_26510, partial [Escherichia coli]
RGGGAPCRVLGAGRQVIPSPPPGGLYALDLLKGHIQYVGGAWFFCRNTYNPTSKRSLTIRDLLFNL